MGPSDQGLRFPGRLRSNGNRCASQLEIEPEKASASRHAHGVSFEDGQSDFSDERARLIDDPDHSEDEERFLPLGLRSTLRLLVVAHYYRAEGGTIRIISARKATCEEQAHCK